MRTRTQVQLSLQQQTPEIRIYDEIVSDSVYQNEVWFCDLESGGSCDCQEKVQVMSGPRFRELLSEHSSTEEIVVKINSQGGSYSTALEMIDTLKEHPAKITTRCVGMAYSAASVLLVSGDRREIAPGGIVMIHDPTAVLGGGQYSDAELEAIASEIKAGKAAAAALYASRSKASEQQIKDWSAKETYFSAEEALQHGFVDAILESTEADDLGMKKPSPPLQMQRQTPASIPADPLYETVASRRRHRAGVSHAAGTIQEAGR